MISPEILYLDLETFSFNHIAQGTYKYAEKSEILLCAYAWGSDKPVVADLTNGDTLPAVKESTIVCAHNSSFDRVILAFHGSPIAKRRFIDTAVFQALHSAPVSLSDSGAFYGLGSDKAKDKAGKKLINLFCKPQGKNRKIKRCTRLTHPKEWKAFVKYAAQDIVSMREVHKAVPTWNMQDFILKEWIVDQKINDRGFNVDIDLVKAAMSLTASSRETLSDEIKKLTGGVVSSPNQVAALREYLLTEHGLDMPNLSAYLVGKFLETENISEGAKDILRCRKKAANSSISKYIALFNAINEDNRMRGTLKYCGAQRTGRWSARIFQPHNQPRPLLSFEDIQKGVKALKGGYSEFLYNTETLLKSCIRSCIVPTKGKKLIVSDLSAIEGRALAWLAGAQWKLDAYAAGKCLYKMAYAMTFNIEYETVTGEQRTLGKVLELALGYGGGVGAFVTFAESFNIDLKSLSGLGLDIPVPILADSRNWYHKAVERGLDCGLDEETFVTCDSIKRMWRKANPEIQQFWYDLENAFKSATVYASPTKVGKLTIDRVNDYWGRIQLPSGRFMCYPSLKMNGKKLTYLGYDSSWRWCRQDTYGGKLAENVTQAVSRDILAHSLCIAEDKNYSPVLHVHDEIVCEVPDNDNFNIETLDNILKTNPVWALDLPLDAKGYEGHMYRK